MYNDHTNRARILPGLNGSFVGDNGGTRTRQVSFVESVGSALSTGVQMAATVAQVVYCLAECCCIHCKIPCCCGGDATHSCNSCSPVYNASKKKRH